MPAGYDELNDPTIAALDFVNIDALDESGAEISTDLLQRADGTSRFRIYRRGESIPLADMLPLLEHLGLRALDERAFGFGFDGATMWLHDVGVALPAGAQLTEAVRAEVQQTFLAEFSGSIEVDGLNRLVLLGGLTARQIDILRAYSRYLRQIGFPVQPAVHRIDDGATRARSADRSPGCSQRVSIRLWSVTSSTPRHRCAPRSPKRSTPCRVSTTTEPFVPCWRSSTRPCAPTRFGRATAAGTGRCSRSSSTPPRSPTFRCPARCSRSGCVRRVSRECICATVRIARGGIRWSDRREDFRTEVLGLVKAQIVKNAVIVPTGAKGGFVLKKPPPAGTDEFRAEGVACYRQFISGLLDLTDNIVAGAIVPPPDTVRLDVDDPYLVVAADKGTASFSDIANEISASYSFWLGDAFASGGSDGYDHKAMGITARGAWESVRRHARALGKDADNDELTIVGIGDMSGDVFGNGLLQSPHVKLVAAFDHRHIFIDPDPDPAVSYAERRRLFELPRSSWANYDTTLLSTGGGVFPRTLKIDLAQRRGVQAAWHRPDHIHTQRVDVDHPARAGRRVVERRHRHVRQGVHRVARRRR